MEYAKSPALWTTAAVAVGGLATLRWLATAPLPKRGADERAALAKEWWGKYLKITPHFDQFISDLVIHSMTPEGKASGSITVKGPLVSADGVLHEGGLFELIDTFGSLSVMALGHTAGVSLEMGASILAPVSAGEELKLDSYILRIGSTVAFTVVERWFQRKTLKYLEDFFKPMAKVEPKNMDEALALQPLPPGTGADSFATEHLHLLNGYWAGHGASSAGLIAAAARMYAQEGSGRGVSFQDMSVLYMNPVPRFKPVGFVVTLLSEANSVRQYVVEMRDETKAFVRARLTAVLS